MSSRGTYLTAVLVGLFFGAILTIAAQGAISERKSPSVPKASCGPQDRTESVQGQTTLAERFSPGPSKAYTCNLELVGQFEGEGTSFDLEVFGHCAYYSTAPNPQMRHPGVAVLDVSDPRHPKATAYLNSPAMLDAVESLEIDPTRKLLLANKPPTTSAAPFDIYDLSADCRHPVLKSSRALPGMMSHGGQFAANSRTFYGASIYTYLLISKGPADSTAPPPSAVFAIDPSNPSNPRGIATWIPPKKEWRTHSVSVNKDGTRAYVAVTRDPWDYPAKARRPNGLAILDISDIQARRPNPQFRLISTLFWDDTHAAQFTRPVTIQGQPYLIFTDLMGAIGIERPPRAGACNSGEPGHGFARIIHIGDEQHPKTVSKLMLEVHDPSKCEKVIHDPTVFGGYGTSGCDVDNDENGKLLACGYFEGGLRVFDIRNPLHPREVAYYKPPARRTETRPGSPIPTFKTALQFPGFQKDHTADAVIFPKFRKNGEEIWFNSFDNGFQVVRFTDRFQASHSELFRN